MPNGKGSTANVQQQRLNNGKFRSSRLTMLKLKAKASTVWRIFKERNVPPPAGLAGETYLLGKVLSVLQQRVAPVGKIKGENAKIERQLLTYRLVLPLLRNIQNYSRTVTAARYLLVGKQRSRGAHFLQIQPQS